MGRGLVLAVALVCALAGAQSAQAGTIAKVGSEYQYSEPAESATNDQVNLYYCAGSGCSGNPGDPGNYFIIGGVLTPNAGSSGCFLWPYSSNYMQCPVAGISRWRISMAGGNDVVSLPSCCGEMTVPVAIFGEAGNDSVDVGAGSQDDVLDGGPGTDSLFGGLGNDVLDGGFGNDTLNGGGGTDTVTFAARSEGVTVDLGNAGPDDGSANDGAPGARDSILNVEGVVGGSAGDDIDGSTASTALTIEGGGGGDRIRGGLGPNTLRGEGGNDNLEGRGASDTLNGGDGHDTMDGLGGADILRGGPGFDSIYALDGVADDVDCGADDDVATTDSVDTRVNCDPAPAPASGSGGTTTNTTTTVTVFGPARLVFDLGYVYSATRRATTLSEVSLEVERGAQLKATCRTPKGKRCERTRDLTKAATSATVRLRGFERKPLPVGSKLQIRATKRNMVGAVKTVTIRKRKAPSVKTLCLPPGATRPASC